MDKPAQLTQKVIDTWKTAQPIYGNHAPIYGNQTPICPPHEKLYDFFVLLHSANHKIYAKLDAVLRSGTLQFIPDVIDYLKEDTSKEVVLVSKFLIFFLEKTAKRKDIEELK
jgi:hypothetical protein